MSLILESPVNRAMSYLMVIDVSFAALIISGYGLLVNHNPVAIFTTHPSLLFLAIMFPFTLYLAELYDLNRKWLSFGLVVRTIVTVTVTVAIFGGSHYLFCGQTDLLMLFPLMMVGMATEIVAVRNVSAARIKQGRAVRKALVVGAGWGGRLVIDTILREPRLKIKVAGIIDDSMQKRSFTYKGIKVLGNRNVLMEEIDKLEVKMIILAISYAQNAELIKSLLFLKMRGVDVVDMPAFYERVTGQIPIKHVQDFWFLYSGGFDILHRPIIKKIKRMTDLMTSFLGLFLSLPLMGIIALLIKIDSRGPVFFSQERVGQDEKIFNIIKFRSMRVDAEEKSGPIWASERDYRVTRIGRWLRLTRLDEIPQFINVLKGDMSFIGPRPERPFFVDRLKEVIPYYGFRFSVKPGLSGWAQVNYHYGASTEDAIEKLKYDLYYIKNMSFWLDLLITFKTLKVVFFALGT